MNRKANQGTWRASQGEITPGILQNLLRDKKDNPDFLQADNHYYTALSMNKATFSFTKESHSSCTENKTPEFLKSMHFPIPFKDLLLKTDNAYL